MTAENRGKKKRTKKVACGTERNELGNHLHVTSARVQSSQSHTLKASGDTAPPTHLHPPALSLSLKPRPMQSHALNVSGDRVVPCNSKV